MSDIVIKAENLGKKYIIGHQAENGRYVALRDVLMHNAKTLWNKTRDLLKGKAVIQGDTMEEVWALKDINFEIKRGEAVGIIGRNGAGKSTLLKILSRITEPSTGRVTIRGRVASLLEVGTGFHPELTGRENIYLNGTILGMTRVEIKKKFDEIVAFAEIEKFLDTPVKRYSSGMYMRLAFAVAAHLEPEILLVDEVLAVGDAQFQKKCLGKMKDIAGVGRTILFVSHNMAAVKQLCKIGILLEQSRIKQTGMADKIIQLYMKSSDLISDKIDLSGHQPIHGTGDIVFEWARLQNADQEPCREFSIGENVHILFGIKSKDIKNKLTFSVEIHNTDGISICNMVAKDSGFQIDNLSSNNIISVCIEDIRLYPDQYFISLWVGSETGIETYDYVTDCLSFDILDGGRYSSRRLPRGSGILFMTPKWESI